MRKDGEVMINEKLIPLIEKALGIKLFPIVIKSLTTQEECQWEGRRCGFTTAYILKLVLDKDKKISLRDLKLGKYNDGYHGHNYNVWFTYEFMHIRNLLKENGFEVVEVKI